MKIAVASDHGGFEFKQIIIQFLREQNVEVVDAGCNDPQSVDYPTFADAVCAMIKNGEVERGILICGTGIGMSIAANRYRHVRAALCHDGFTARMSREHNNANVLCLGGRVLGVETAKDIVKQWVETEFTGGRHQRRLDMIS